MINRRMPRGYPRQPLPYIGPWPTTPAKRRTRLIIAWLGIGLPLLVMVAAALAMASAALVA